MTDKKDKALKLALEALEQWNTPLYKRGNVITALRRALAVSETHKQPAYRAVKTVHEGKAYYVSEPEQPAQQEPEYKGWYCAHCQRGVDGSEVTYHEQHTVCGRVITDDVPPKAQQQEPVAWVNWCAATGKRSVSFECESELASQPLYAGITQNTQSHYSKFHSWFDSELHRQKYTKDHPAYLAAQEAWNAANDAAQHRINRLNAEIEAWKVRFKIAEDALAKLNGPEQKPVAWVGSLKDPQPHCVTDLKYCSAAQWDTGYHLKYIPLYTSPPANANAGKPWVGLTDVEWMNIVNKDHAWFGQRPEDVAHEVAKLVEAKLKEKNNG